MQTDSDLLNETTYGSSSDSTGIAKPSDKLPLNLSSTGVLLLLLLRLLSGDLLLLRRHDPRSKGLRLERTGEYRPGLSCLLGLDPLRLSRVMTGLLEEMIKERLLNGIPVNINISCQFGKNS